MIQCHIGYNFLIKSYQSRVHFIYTHCIEIKIFNNERRNDSILPRFFPGSFTCMFRLYLENNMIKNLVKYTVSLSSGNRMF